jgi:Outer membrane protein
MKRTLTFLVCLFLQAGMVFCQKTLSLENCRNMALEHNKSIQISQQKLLSSIDNRKAAFTQFLPSFNAIATYNYNSKDISLLSSDALLPVGTKASDGSFTVRADQMANTFITLANGQTVPLDASGNPFNPVTNPEKIQFKDYAYLPKESMTFDIHNIFTVGVGFTQPIFMGGKILEFYNISKTMEQMSKIQLNASQVNLMVEVDEAYWRVVSLVNKYNLAKEYHTLLDTTYNNVKEMVNAGVATKSDLLKVKVKLNEADMSLSKAQNGLALSKMLLCQIIGMPLDSEFNLEDENLSSYKEEPLVNNYEIRASLKNRNETQLLESAIKIAQSTEKIAWSRFMPNIVGTANYVASNPNIFNGFDKNLSGMFTIGIALQMPLFHFGERVHTLNAAKRDVIIAELTRDEAVEKMELQVNQMQFKVNEAKKQSLMATNNIEQANENLKDAKEGFDAGVIPLTDYMGAQTAFVSAKSEDIDAKINSIMTKIYLEKSLGNLKVPDNKQVENKK